MDHHQIQEFLKLAYGPSLNLNAKELEEKWSTVCSNIEKSNLTFFQKRLILTEAKRINTEIKDKSPKQIAKLRDERRKKLI